MIEYNVSDFSIQNGVLKKCYSLESYIEIPLGVTEIGEGAFYNNRLLKSVIIPEGVTQIGEQAFAFCENLTELKLPQSLLSIEWLAFRKCQSLKRIDLPDGLEFIGPSAFYNTGLEYIKLPDRVNRVSGGTFSGCRSLRKVILPDSIMSIEHGAFKNCASLEYINIPEKAVVSESAFLGCIGLADNKGFVIFGDKLNGYSGNDSVIELPENIKTIGSDAFSDCINLVKVKIPEGLTEIGSGAFNGCVALEEVILPESLSKLGSFAFCNCSSLTEISLPDGLTEIGGSAFRGCSRIKSISLPFGVTVIEDKTFESCTALGSISLPYGLKKVRMGAFANCKSLKSISFPETVEEFGSDILENCESMEDVYIPESIDGLDMVFGDSFPKKLFGQIGKLASRLSDRDIKSFIPDKKTWDGISPEAQLEIFLHHQTKALTKLYEKYISAEQAVSIAAEIPMRLNGKPSAKLCSAAAAFVLRYYTNLPDNILSEIYESLKGVKTGAKAVQKIENETELIRKIRNHK